MDLDYLLAAENLPNIMRYCKYIGAKDRIMSHVSRRICGKINSGQYVNSYFPQVKLRDVTIISVNGKKPHDFITALIYSKSSRNAMSDEIKERRGR